MQNATGNAAVERIGRRDTTAREPAALLDVRAVAAMCGCSSRHIYRLSDAGKMPRPLRIGRLIRWRRAALETWIADGCASCASRGGR